MGALDVITKAPEFQEFKSQVQALLAMVQDTNARVRRHDAAIGAMQLDLHQIKNATVPKEVQP